MLQEVTERGERVYHRGSPNRWPLAVRSLVGVGKTKLHFESVSGAGDGKYVLSKKMHDLIMQYGNWTYGWTRD